MPPFNITAPNPAFVALRNYMCNKGYNVDTIYWNIIFNNNIMSSFKINNVYNQNEVELIDLLPFYSIIAHTENDNKTEKMIRIFLLSFFPLFREYEKVKYSNNFISTISNEIYNIINIHLNNINFEKVLLFGVSARYFQWIPGSILVKVVKDKYPYVNTIIGGFGNKEEAIVLMDKFKQFDYAIWGEAEYPLHLLCNALQNNNQYELSNVPNLIRRANNKLIISKISNKIYIDLNTIKNTDFDDYLKNFKIPQKVNISLPIETGRGCHWNKCKFCFLNLGYKYRKKAPRNIITEIETLCKKYNIFNIEFIDNDLIGKDVEYINELLDLLIEYNNRIEGKLNIVLAEINSDLINKTILEKMSKAGFKKIQIGYEAISDKLLKKINKKSNFSHHLVAIKFAQEYGIQITRANIIVNLPDENEEDIIDSIENLHFLRFYLGRGTFNNEMTKLAVSYFSRYYQYIKEKEWREWKYNRYKIFLPENYFKDEDVYKIFNFMKEGRNILWKYFEKINNNYINIKYKYKLIHNDESILFEEYIGNKIIKVIKFNDLYWEVLRIANDSVVSIHQMHKCLIEKGYDIAINYLKQVIDELKKVAILYTNDDYSNIISIINTDRLQYTTISPKDGYILR